MNREDAETYLRLLAEAELRDPLSVRAPASAGAPSVTVPIKVTRVAWAVRHRPEPAGPPTVRRRIRRRTTAAPLTRGTGSASAGTPDRHVPVGRTLPFHDSMVSGQLDLISFSHTARGARFTVSWRIRNLLGPSPAEWPFFQFIARDDRGHRYRPDFQMVGHPEAVCYLSLDPEPPRDMRWLDVTAPGEAAVRITLEREGAGIPDGAEAQVTETGLSSAEHLLNRIGHRLLAIAPQDQRALTLRLVPPLARSTPWIEVLVCGRSAEVQARLPLRWASQP